MKVISWNVNGRVRAAQKRQLGVLVRRNADIIALQEIRRNAYDGWCEGLTTAGYSVVSTRELVDLPYPAPPYQSPPFQRKRPTTQIQRAFFNITGARVPIAPVAGLAFPNEDEAKFAFPEKFLAASVRVGGTRMHVFNAHLPPGVSRGQIKVHAFEAIRRRVDGRRQVPRILLGDFNAPWTEDDRDPHAQAEETEDPEAQRWAKAELSVIANPELPDTYRSLREAHGTKGLFPASYKTGATLRRYDHIFASEDFEVIECRYHNAWRRRGLSDHAAVEAVLKLKENVSRKRR